MCSPIQYPKISLVTISYNQEEFLNQTMRSVLDQNYPNLEYVVIDGGSKDRSVEVIKKYADRLAYWVSEPDKGPTEALNKGFAHTTGKIMGWINSSDIQLPWTCDIVSQVFSDLPQVDWITGIASHVDDGMAPKNISIVFPNKYEYLSGTYSALQQESTFWRRSLWEKAGASLDTSLKHVFEFSLWLKFARFTPLYQVNTVLASFRLHGDRILPSEKDRKRQLELLAEFRASCSAKDRARGILLAATNNAAGRMVQTFLRKGGLMKWHRKPRILRDFDTHRWVVKEH